MLNGLGAGPDGGTAEKPVGTVWIGVPRHRRKKVSSGRNGERDVAEGGFIGYNSAVQYG